MSPQEKTKQEEDSAITSTSGEVKLRRETSHRSCSYTVSTLFRVCVSDEELTRNSSQWKSRRDENLWNMQEILWDAIILYWTRELYTDWMSKQRISNERYNIEAVFSDKKYFECISFGGIHLYPNSSEINSRNHLTWIYAWRRNCLKSFCLSLSFNPLMIIKQCAFNSLEFLSRKRQLKIWFGFFNKEKLREKK